MILKAVKPTITRFFAKISTNPSDSASVIMCKRIAKNRSRTSRTRSHIAKSRSHTSETRSRIAKSRSRTSETRSRIAKSWSYTSGASLRVDSDVNFSIFRIIRFFMFFIFLGTFSNFQKFQKCVFLLNIFFLHDENIFCVQIFSVINYVYLATPEII